MKPLLFATNNPHKKVEIQKILGSDYLVKSLSDVHIFEEIEENGSSFEENAKIKAKYCFEKTGIPSIGDDSGLVVEALGGNPGIYSARYAGDHDFAKNIEKVLDEMKHKTNRNAYFITVLCYYDGIKAVFFEGRVHGQLTEKNLGSNGFGYNPIFIPEGFTNTFAEMTAEAKNAISHRKKALSSLLENISKL